VPAEHVGESGLQNNRERGSGFSASKNFNKKTAQYIILGGLTVQILGLGLFAITALVWLVRMRAAPLVVNGRKKWQKIMAMLYAVNVLIMVRSVFRVVEYVMGTDGYLSRHEWSLYVFDAVLMMLTVGVFAWWYPDEMNYSLVAAKCEMNSGSDMALNKILAEKDRQLGMSRL
jgi:hypothetical protein